MATRQPPTTTHGQPQRRRDHRDPAKYLSRKRLCFVLCGLGASAVRKAALRQTKPIRAEAASALMMDNRLLMIWARQWPWPEASELCPRCAKQTQFRAFLARKRGCRWKTKPIGAAGGRDWRLEIADWGFEAMGPRLRGRPRSGVAAREAHLPLAVREEDGLRAPPSPGRWLPLDVA
jgi:hypothetical protein